MFRFFAVVAAVAVVASFSAAAPAAEEGSMVNLLSWDSSAESGGWQQWFPREEIAPALAENADEGGMLVAEGRDLQYCIGGWQRSVTDVEPGKDLTVHAEVECSNMDNPLGALWIRVYWKGQIARGTAADMIDLKRTCDGVYTFEDRVTVPDGATSCLVRLIYRWEPKGRAVWKNISMTPAPPAAPHRKVRISTVYWRPTERTTVENNLQNFVRMVDQAAADKPDIVVISEGCVSIRIGFRDMDAVSEEIPGGRFYKAFAAKAKEHGCYICYGTYERDGIYIFNTAVLIDPEGNLVGKYRKIHLPIGTGEDTVGLAPGSTYDVFDTPLGRLGIVICWDTAFPESIRCSRLNGADIVLVPIWGGNEEQIKVAARENGVCVVTASFDIKCMVVNQRGEVLAETWKNLGTGVATATCDIDDRTKRPWAGDVRSYMGRLRRPDTYGPITRPLK